MFEGIAKSQVEPTDELLALMEKKVLIDDYTQPTNPALEESKTDKWEPKEWRAEYEIIVMMSLRGKKGIEIANFTGYTPQHIYNILGTPQALAIEQAFIAKVRAEIVNIPEEIAEIQKLTVRRLRESLKDDEMFKKMPGTLLSKGLEVMKGTGEHLKNAPTTQNNTTFVLPASVADKFLAGLEKSDQARALLAKNRDIVDAEVIEDDAA